VNGSHQGWPYAEIIVMNVFDPCASWQYPSQPQLGTIIVEKQTDPDGAPQSFTFSGDASGAISDDGQIVVSGLAPGAYTSQEIVPAGWELINIICDDTNSTVSLPDFRANFQLEAGETVKCTFYNRLPLDYGDVPDSYGTLLASNGARHAFVPGHSLGPIVDAEPDGQPSPLADGDDLNPPGAPDDEDGVTLPPALTAGDPAAMVAVDGGPSGGMLDAWIDFNGSGVFDHPAEHLWGGVSQSLNPGPNTLTFPVPATAIPGPTYARFRLSNNGNLPPTGFVPDGEVEDYLVEIEALPQPGTIIVEKQTDPDGAPDSFTFSGDASGAISDGGQIVVSGLPPGTYSSQETVPAGWALTSIVCDDTNSSGDVNTATATFQLEAGETVTCTFTNTPDGDVSIWKAQTAGDTVLPGETFFYDLTIQNAYDGLVDMLVQDTLSTALDYVDDTLEIRKDGVLVAGVDDDLVMAGDILNYRMDMSGIDELNISFDVKVSDLVDVGTIIRNMAVVTVFYPGTDIVIGGNESNIVQTEVVPEPSTVFLLGIGVLGMYGLARRKILRKK
jgi:hypothetical protein